MSSFSRVSSNRSIKLFFYFQICVSHIRFFSYDEGYAKRRAYPEDWCLIWFWICLWNMYTSHLTSNCSFKRKKQKLTQAEGLPEFYWLLLTPRRKNQKIIPCFPLLCNNWILMILGIWMKIKFIFSIHKKSQ